MIILEKNKIDLTVLIPTKNEEITISQFLDWCDEGFRLAHLQGEVVLMDSSTDRTPEIAKSKGAKVVRVLEPGLGIAYLTGKKHIHGKYVILGDADCTYDFRNLQPFLDKLNEGFDLVVGNRFKGSIEKAAMPLHHQYFGSPGTSFVFKHSLGIPVGDIHCGMRAMTKELYQSLPFTELGWEYATEMIVSSRNIGARICEIPINFFKEPKGRISHQKRNGWTTPFKAGWGTLRVTASFSLDRLLSLPGLILGAGGTALNFLLLTQNFIAPQEVRFGLYTSSMLAALSLIGWGMASLGFLSHFVYYPTGRLIKILGSQNLCKRLFMLSTFSILSNLILLFILANAWIEKNLIFFGEGSREDLKLVLGFNFMTQISAGLLALLACSFIGGYLDKLRIRQNSKVNFQ